MTDVRADIAELFEALTVPDAWQLSASALPHQRTGVVTRAKVEREPCEPAQRAPGRGKAQHAALKADPERWAAKLAYQAAYKARTRDRSRPRGHNTRKLDDAAVAHIRTSTASVSALARLYGVDRAAIRYHRKAQR